MRIVDGSELQLAPEQLRLLSRRPRYCDPDEPLPFEEVLAPFVKEARPAIAADGLLVEEAQAALERLLLQRLTSLSSRTLYLEFSLERARRLSPLARLLARAGDDPPRHVYESFVERMLGRDLDGVLDEYPVLARLMGRVIELWAEATAEFVERLRADREEIQRVFGGGLELGPVTRVEPGLSDPHRGARMVIALTFSSGTRVVYKPKDLGTERAWNRLLSWFNERDPPLLFRVLDVLPRPGYGWVEYVQDAPCRDLEDAVRYYRRAGMLVCLVYALAGTDCHRGNLIAAGEHPVIVDVESLMHHRPCLDGESTGARELALDELASGVLGTGLLPSWQVEGEADTERVSDISALHTAAPEELVRHIVKWEDTNTDGMLLVRGPVTLPVPKSQPLLDDRQLRLEDHAADVIAGFEQFYEFLLQSRPALLAEGSPLHELGRQPVRFIYRNTRVYSALHRQLLDPSHLRDEAGRRAQLERLRGTGGGSRPADPHWRPLVDAEIDSMEQVDIPLFTARAGETVLTLAPERELEGCLREPSAQFVIDRIRGLGRNDMEQQASFVAGSLYANSARHEPPPAARAPVTSGAAHGGEPADLERAAVEIADEIAVRAVRAPGEDGATWIAPQYVPRVERYQLQPIAFDLHSGACGIALFLAAVERVTNGADHGRLALAAVRPFQDALARHGEDLAHAMGFGAASGLGSAVYTLTLISSLLDEPALLDTAMSAAALLTDQRISVAPADVFEGLAGEILGLLALHEVAPEAGVLERAEACGRRLLSARTPGEGGRLAWVTFEGRMLTGFSHGAAGIAYALARLHGATGDEAYRSAAIDAIASENLYFDPDLGNWLDLREEVQPAFKAQWCHGAPGIGMARLGGLPMLDTERVGRDVEAALRTTLSIDHAEADHVCCGNLGRADVLLVAGERLGRPDLTGAAHARVHGVVRRADEAGGFSLHHSLPRRVYAPGFFMGMAGVGYQLLRTAHPRVLPSVLLWELPSRPGMID